MERETIGRVVDTTCLIDKQEACISNDDGVLSFLFKDCDPLRPIDQARNLLA